MTGDSDVRLFFRAAYQRLESAENSLPSVELWTAGRVNELR
jgi:hypothetical protein